MFGFADTWQFNLFAYLVSIVLFYQFYKLAVTKTNDDATATVLIQIIAALSIILLLPFFPFTLPENPMIYLLLLAGCLFFAISDRLQTTARKHLQISAYAVIEQLVTVFLVFYGFTLFREPFSMEKVIGVLLIIGGNIFLHHKNVHTRNTKYIIFGILAALAAATAVSIDISIMENFNLPFFVFLTFIIPASFVALVGKVSPSKVWHEYQYQNKKYYMVTGISFALAVFFSLRSLQFGEVSTVVPLQATAVLLNVLVAYIFLGERDQKHKKLLAAAFVIIGVYVTTLA